MASATAPEAGFSGSRRRHLDWAATAPDPSLLLQFVTLINLLLLLVNLLPVYPLDGGQILQALLWYAPPHFTQVAWACAVTGPA